MKQFIFVIVLIFFSEAGIAADDNYQSPQADKNTLIFAMPGRKPVIINPDTGDIKEIVPAPRLKKENKNTE